MFNAGARLGDRDGGKLVIEKEGKVKKLVDEVEHVSFSGARAIAQGQDITYITERCVMKLTPAGIVRHRDRAGRGSGCDRGGRGGGSNPRRFAHRRG
jgi:hypothetical protein